MKLLKDHVHQKHLTTRLFAFIYINVGQGHNLPGFQTKTFGDRSKIALRRG